MLPNGRKGIANPAETKYLRFGSRTDGRRMEILITVALVYVAIGAAAFAHPASPALPDDFHWRTQVGVFRATLPEVLAWPLGLWRFGLTCLGRD